MIRPFGAIALAIALAVPAAADPAALCTCAAARAVNGWCPAHDFGFVAGVKVTSRWLYEAADAHGHAVDVTTFLCPTCKTAIATNGYCEAHKIGFVNKLAYMSRLTYELAKGEVRAPSAMTCPTCRKNSETHGWCARSRVGMIGLTAISDRASYERAVAALEIFLVANETAVRCRYCAVAIITDTECPICRIAYKGGKAVPHAT